MLALTPTSISTPTPHSPLAATRPRRRRLASTAAAAAAAVSSSKSDDYHATIKSLNSRGRRHVPKKSLGQHYMLNSEINDELVSVAGVEEGDVVLEIGPGTGSLTNALLQAGATVIAVEKDVHMAALLKDRYGCTEQVKVIQEDFNKCHIRAHISPLLENKSQGINKTYAKVVSNIPFNISTDVVKQLLPMGDVFSIVALLLQDEAALRLAEASIETPEYRPINIFVNFYSEPEYKFKVERKNFFPQPKIDAAVVTFKLKHTADYPSVVSPKKFFSMISCAFVGKRKMLRKTLQHMCPPSEIEAALSDIGLPITARPGELTLDDFVNLHNLLEKV